MKTRLLALLSIIPLIAGVSCTSMNPTSASNANVEQIERDGADIQPNLDHGQHEAGRNATDFQNGTRRYYRDGRYYDDRYRNRAPGSLYY